MGGSTVCGFGLGRCREGDRYGDYGFDELVVIPVSYQPLMNKAGFLHARCAFVSFSPPHPPHPTPPHPIPPKAAPAGPNPCGWVGWVGS